MKVRSSALAGCLAVIVGGAFVPCASAAPARLFERTVQIPGVPCSVSAWDYLSNTGGQYTLQYGGGTSCADGAGLKTLNVVPQVFKVGRGQLLWFHIGGAGLYQGPTPANPLRRGSSRAAVASHNYRVLVYAQVLRPDGRLAHATACASCSGTNPSLSIAWPRGNIYSWPPAAARMRGINCTVMVSTTLFPNINGTTVMSYGGSLLCDTGASGLKRLKIAAEVGGSGPNRGRYFTVSGSTLTSGPTSRPYQYLSTGRTVYIGHPYRIVVTGSVTINGRTTTATAHSITAGP